MVFERNVGRIDRVARGVLGTCLLAVVVRAVLDGERGKALVAGIASAGLLFNVVTGWCGLNAVLGVDSCRQ